MKPNQSFRMYCRLYPGLIGSTYMNYMHPWSEKTLNKVADIFLSDHPISADFNFDETIEHMVHVHQSVHIYSQRFLAELNRLNVVTPKHYLEYIHIYIQLMGKFQTLFLLRSLSGCLSGASSQRWFLADARSRSAIKTIPGELIFIFFLFCFCQRKKLNFFWDAVIAYWMPFVSVMSCQRNRNNCSNLQPNNAKA